MTTVLVYGSGPPKNHEDFSKNLEKYVWINSFLEPAALLKMSFFWGIFQGFC